MLQDLPETTAAIQNGIERQMHTGVQVYVSLNGQPVVNDAIGMATADRAMSSETIMLWRSAGKPITAAAICRLWEQGDLSLDSPLSEYLPEAAHSVLGDVTIQQILTHTSGIPLIDTHWPTAGWDDIVARIERQVTHVGSLTDDGAYQPQSTWFLLGEILQRTDAAQRKFQDIVADDVLQAIGIREAWCGLPESLLPEIQERLPDFYVREKGRLVHSDYGTPPWLTQPSPGGNMRGPVRELGRFYEMLLHDGKVADGGHYLQPATVASMTSRHRTDTHDTTFQHAVDFGLGLIIDSNHHGHATVPYGFGQYCSERTFGHGGAQCAMGFCDPDAKLVVAWAANGFCGEGQHQRRNRAINEAVYQDLGLAKQR
ncbi:serine hydrolase domain-containing protein [Fuerstiella marisgermanici]|uniref:Esterase EstB n=1 Tax=Fuerstiella marisgermanici TaxID=1891926 RepID=A0A1P8W9W7_9PLAN|nr:serine hydrolase domain-containing protein [Fuerstiella marisgermanici]APZ90852.1 Esterase EstB [Fuerstiella marisgermanici]